MVGDYDLSKLRNRLKEKSKEVGDCLIWTGRIERGGYGRITVNDRPFSTHRLSYFLYVEPIKAGFVIDHICKNRACLNPKHLRQVTQRVNCYENSLSSCYLNSLKTHCSKGHEFTPENTQIKKTKHGTSRSCRACNRIYAQKKRDEAKAAA